MMEWFHQVDWFAVLCWLGAISCIVAGLGRNRDSCNPRSSIDCSGGRFNRLGWQL